jgi:hypothetical protein
MNSLSLYLTDSVKYNTAHYNLKNHSEKNPKVHYALTETMKFLFADNEILYDEKSSARNTSFVLYELQSDNKKVSEGKEDKEHTVILFNRVLYEMIDGWLYTNKLILTDEFIEHHSSELCKTKLKIVKKTYFNIKPENESKKLLDLLDIVANEF